MTNMSKEKADTFSFEEQKKFVLGLLEVARYRVEQHTIQAREFSLDQKITPTYEMGIREPVKIISKGFKLILDIEYLDQGMELE